MGGWGDKREEIHAFAGMTISGWDDRTVEGDEVVRSGCKQREADNDTAGCFDGGEGCGDIAGS